MSIRYISIPVSEISSEYLAKVLNNYKLEPNDGSLVYVIEDDRYFMSRSPPQVWAAELIRTNQNEFIKTIEQYKLLKLLNQ